MFLFTALVLVPNILSMANGDKTRQEWSAAIDQLMEDFSKFNNVDDYESLKNLDTEDVHRFPPGNSEIDGPDDPVLRNGTITVKQDELRSFCGIGAVSEFTITLVYPSDVTRYGKGMALVIEDNRKVKFHSFIWNFDDKDDVN